MDTPNVVAQANKPRKSGEDKAVMKIEGKLVDILVNLHLNVCDDCMAMENYRKVSHMETSKAVHDILEAALLWH